jgi:predicted phosphodiesterase
VDLTHELIADLKRVASELGRVPSRDEYRSLAGFSRQSWEKAFGTFTIFVQAAGLVPAKQKQKDIFRVDLKSLLDKKSTPSKIAAPSKQPPQPDLHGSQSSERILVIGDTHFPFADAGALSALYLVAEKLRPTLIVQVGDLYDMFAHSKFPRTHLTFDPQQEVRLGFEMANNMWETLRSISPKASFHQLLGNHDARPLKRILEAYPQGEIFFSIEKWFQFPSVHTYFDTRQEVVLSGIIFQHGYRAVLGAHRDHNLQNTVCGHSHRGGVSFRQIDGKILWELNAGFLGDASSKALSYTPQRITAWTLGCGWIDEFGPRFIPF